MRLPCHALRCLPACPPTRLDGRPKEKAEGEMKPTRTGGGSNARLSCNASRDQTRVCTDTRAAPALTLLRSALFCLVSSARRGTTVNPQQRSATLSRSSMSTRCHSCTRPPCSGPATNLASRIFFPSSFCPSQLFPRPAARAENRPASEAAQFTATNTCDAGDARDSRAGRTR